MKETVTITITKSVGYSGKGGKKSYIAKIDGTSKQYIFSRSFIETEAVDKAEMFKARRKGKGSWTEAAALDAGLYEICRCGEKKLGMVWMKPEAGAVWANLTEDRVIAIALLIDDGQTFDDARKATKPPQESVPAQ